MFICYKSGHTCIFIKENQTPFTSCDLLMEHLNEQVTGRLPESNNKRARERKRKTGIWQSSQQLIIGSYYWGTVSARREVGFQSLLKTLMVQNRPHYRDIISIHTLTELLGCLLGKIRFLHLRTSSLSGWLTEPCSQFVAHPRCTDGLRAHIQCNPSAADV